MQLTPGPACDHAIVSSLPRCYVASPLGFTEGGRHYYRSVYLPALESVVIPVDPWALTAEDEIRAAHDRGQHREIALEIGRRNTAAIRSCELLVAYLEGQEADSGTTAELGYAAALHVKCFALRSDLRLAGELGVEVNPQVETFVADSGGAICNSLAQLIAALQASNRQDQVSPSVDG